MNDLQVTLHGMWLQEEWRCAWEAVSLFARQDGGGRQGKNQAVTYTFDTPDGEELSVAVWRSKHGLNAVRVEE